MSLLPVNNPLMAAAMGNMTPIGAPPSPPPSISGGLMGLLNNPMFMMGAGLMGGAQPGGTFAGGLNMGLANMMNMQRQQQATALLGAQIAQMKWKREQAEAKARADALAAQQAAANSAAVGINPGMEPTAKQINALSMGLKPGTPEWNKVMEGGPLATQTTNVYPAGGTAVRAANPTEQAAIEEARKTGVPLVDSKGKLINPPAFPDAQAKASSFAERMIKADEITRAVDFDMSGSFTGRAGILPQDAQPAAFQQKKQAERDWIKAKLRKESGATLTDKEEATERETYFPEPGDSDQVKAQKRAARITATQSMIREAGQAFQGDYSRKFWTTKEQPGSAKPGDIWMSPTGEFYELEAD